MSSPVVGRAAPSVPQSPQASTPQGPDLSPPARRGGAQGARLRQPRRPSELDREDVAVALGCAASSVAGCWLVFARLTEGIGWFGFLLVAYFVFLALFYFVTRERVGPLVGMDRTVSVAIWSAALIVLVPLLWLTLYIFITGISGLSLGFFTHDMRGVSPTQPATAGGGLAAIIGTLEEVGLALILSVPLAMATAVFLNETRSRWRRPVRIFVDAMSGKPSIVAGLFIYAVLILPFARFTSLFGYNGLMAALALSLTMMPTVARTVEVVLRVVPGGLREAGFALGSSRARTVWSVVLPTARSGISTAVVLGIARVVGETAPLLFTSFGTTLLNANPFSGEQESLPLYIYSYIREPYPTTIQRGQTGALALMVLVLLLFVIARLVGRDRTKARKRGLAGRWARSPLRIRSLGRPRLLAPAAYPTPGPSVIVLPPPLAPASQPTPSPSVVIVPRSPTPPTYPTPRAPGFGETPPPPPPIAKLLPVDEAPPPSPALATELPVDNTAELPLPATSRVDEEPPALPVDEEPPLAPAQPVDETPPPFATEPPVDEAAGSPAVTGMSSYYPSSLESILWPWRHSPGQRPGPSDKEGSG